MTGVPLEGGDYSRLGDRHKEGIALPLFPVCRSDEHFCRSAIWPQPAFRLRTFSVQALSQRVVSQMEEM